MESALDQLPAVFTRAQADAAGVSKRQLYDWRDTGAVEPLGRGLFLRTGTPGDPDLIEIAVRAPRATLCLRSALARHGLTDEIPEAIHVAIERTQRPPKSGAPVTWHRFDPMTFDIGREEIKVTDGYRIGLYTPARTIIDTFRLRHIEGLDTANKALQRWVRRPRTRPADLLRLAREFPKAEPAIRAALETLL